jgi:3-dehydroquinate synthase
MRQRIDVRLGERSYPIMIDHGWLEKLGPVAKEYIPYDRVLVVSDRQVGALYGDAAVESLRQSGYLAELFTIADGESNKNLATVSTIYDFLTEYNYPRTSAIIALGGGVVGDIAGFAAATYMRGVSYIQVPTSLLAIVDSSVGGKVGVNHPLGKNLIGAFYQPRLVFIDLALLKTLAQEEFRAGFAEVIKYGVIWDASFFAFLLNTVEKIFALDEIALMRVVQTSCSIKAQVVEQDEKETGLRAILNYGHTIGHALEALTNYNMYRHGEAVAIGMLASAKIAQKMDMVSDEDVSRLWQLLVKAGLPCTMPKLDSVDIIERLRKDKKVRLDKVRFVLPEKIGKVTIRDDVSNSLIRDVIEAMREERDEKAVSS